MHVTSRHLPPIFLSLIYKYFQGIAHTFSQVYGLTVTSPRRGQQIIEAYPLQNISVNGWLLVKLSRKRRFAASHIRFHEIRSRDERAASSNTLRSSVM